VSALARAIAESLEANALRLSQPGCIQRPDMAVLALADSLAARGVVVIDVQRRAELDAWAGARQLVAELDAIDEVSPAEDHEVVAEWTRGQVPA
jgi:hypothetical protein